MLQLSSPGVQMDLVLMLAEVGDTLTGHLEYCTDLFSAETGSRMAGHLRVRPFCPASCQLNITDVGLNALAVLVRMLQMMR